MTPGQPITGVRACVFDAYGTLFDFASAAARCADGLSGKAGSFTALWRDKQLQYTWLRTVQGRYADFWQVTGEALDFVLEAFAISDPGLRRRLMDAYRELAAFPEVAAALQALKERGFRTAILSNGAPAMLAAAVGSAGIGHLLDHVLSVDEVQRSNRIRPFISSRLSASAFRLPRSRSCPRMGGMPGRRRRSECGWSGATGGTSRLSGCRGLRIVRWLPWQNCRRC